MACRLEPRREHRADLCRAARLGGSSRCAGEVGVIRSSASRKRSSLGPMHAAESCSGASSAAASSETDDASTASISATIRSSESSSESVISDLPSRFIRVDVDSIESRIRPFRFSFARSSSRVGQVAGGDVGDLLGGDRERLAEVVLARAEVDADLAGVRVLRDERVDRVRHPALLADLLEEARRRRAAEDRVEERGGEAAPVGARDPGRREADVVLLGVLLLEAQPGRRRLDERRPQVRRAAHRPLRRSRPALTSSTTSSCSMFPAAATTMFAGTYISSW